MSTVDMATFKANVDELVTKALDGEVTVISQNGKRAVLMPCEGEAPDFQQSPALDRLLQERLLSEGAEPTAEDWDNLARSIAAR